MQQHRMYPKPPPLRRHTETTPMRLRRMVAVEEARARREERPFDPEAPREHYAAPHHFAVNERAKKRADDSAAAYHVFEMSRRGTPIREVTRAPLSLRSAKELARIGATEGKHDRAVTTSPKRKDFRIVAAYEHGTGRKL